MAPGVPLTPLPPALPCPLCKPFLSEQPTTDGKNYIDNLMSTLTMTQSNHSRPPPPTPPLKNPGYAPELTD